MCTRLVSWMLYVFVSWLTPVLHFNLHVPLIIKHSKCYKCVIGILLSLSHTPLLALNPSRELFTANTFVHVVKLINY